MEQGAHRCFPQNCCVLNCYYQKVLETGQSYFHFDFLSEIAFRKGESPQKVVLFRPKQSCKYLRQLLYPETCSSSAAVSFLDVKNERICEETQQKI